MFSSAVSRRPLAAAITAAILLAVSACSGASPTSGGALSREGAAPAAAAPGLADQANAPAAAKAAPGAAAAGAVDTLAGTDAKIIRTASIYLTVESVEVAAAAVRGVAAGLGGQVTSETVNATAVAPQADPALGGKVAPPVRRVGNYGQLTLAIPADRLDAALDQLVKLGTLIQRATASEDVTAAYVDTESRIATKKASIERVRALMAQTQTISQVVELEGQLAQREAELESLQAQLASMSKRVAMSTVTVTVSSNPEQATVPDDSGFMAGLRSGWKAFQASLTVGLTVLGALLPWLVVVALIGVPILLWRRRQTGTGAATDATGTAGPDSSPDSGPGPNEPGSQE